MRLTKRTLENLNAARQMRDRGATNSEIAIVFGISESTVRQWTDPLYYQRCKKSAMAWNAGHLEQSLAWARKRRQNRTREEMDAANAKQRQRYATNPAYRTALKRLAKKHRGTAQGLLASKIRPMVLGHASHQAALFESFMKAVTGMTREEFTDRFEGDGTFDHITPICAFDLTNPEHLVRCCYPSNLRLIPRKANELKGSIGRNVNVMTLPWIETEDALVQAQTFISRQLKKLKRDGLPSDSLTENSSPLEPDAPVDA